MPGREMKATMVSTTTISPAPMVQPISSRVLPWICAAMRCLRARKRMTVYSSSPSTPIRTIRAMIRTMIQRVWVLSAFGEPPD